MAKESIYAYIYKNIGSDGKLNKNFSLKKFIHPEVKNLYSELR